VELDARLGAWLDDYLQRLDKSDATESGQGGSRVKNLAEKIAAIRERRERHKDMLAELDRTGEMAISSSLARTRGGVLLRSAAN
jgi:hypothetical protein